MAAKLSKLKWFSGENGVKRTTVFKQLILNVITPVLIALFLLGFLNYTHTQSIIVDSNETKNRIITDEIKHILEFQDAALNLIEEQLDARIRTISNALVNDYFKSTENIKTVDLKGIHQELGMKKGEEDIFIIDMETGIIVNTTFPKDAGKNVFDFGESFKRFLQSVVEGDSLVSERFSIEMSTKRIRKYTYQPTLDGKYLVETGNYSAKADDIKKLIQNRLKNISSKDSSLIDVDLFIGADEPFSLITGNTLPKQTKQAELLTIAFENGFDVEYDDAQKSRRYNFMYMKRENTFLYQSSVIEIVSSTVPEKELLREELIKFLIIFGITIMVVIAMIYRKTKVITDPIKKLVDNVNRIRRGNLNDRAEVVGNNEIASLSEHFNRMLEQLEGYYNELENKVAERTRQLQQKTDKIEAQQKAIMDSIHYASRIQNAILPPPEYVRQLVPNAFIFYRPKDIVSGDFYWMTENKNKVMIAAVDCTGHGVPGAFMSIVGNNQLDYAVNVKGLEKPSEILDILNIRVSETVRQKAKEDSVRDGMDMVLISLDKEKGELEFAGAYNPLCIVRNEEIIVIKGDKMPIGSYIEKQNHKFRNHHFKLVKGDMIYLYSDGFADQFGGPKNRKFLSKKFRNLLNEISVNPLSEQYKLLSNVLEGWKGDIPQVDDILVIGIRY